MLTFRIPLSTHEVKLEKLSLQDLWKYNFRKWPKINYLISGFCVEHCCQSLWFSPCLFYLSRICVHAMKQHAAKASYIHRNGHWVAPRFFFFGYCFTNIAGEQVCISQTPHPKNPWCRHIRDHVKGFTNNAPRLPASGGLGNQKLSLQQIVHAPVLGLTSEILINQPKFKFRRNETQSRPKKREEDKRSELGQPGKLLLLSLATNVYIVLKPLNRAGFPSKNLIC